MVNFAQGPATFMNGLSDLWLRFFKDKDTLKAFYRGTEVLVAQAYLELLSTILNISVRETPVFNREHFRLLTVREDQISYSATADRFVFELPDSIKSFKFIYDRLFAPTVVLQENLDFNISLTGTVDELWFRKNPFDWDGAGNVIPGVAWRTVDVQEDDGTITPQRQIAFWLPDVQLDHYNLYLTYGHLLDRFEPSSESYRALLQGIMRYFVMGPSQNNILSALNIVVGMPLVRLDGEVLQEVTTTATAQFVVTNRNTYEFALDVPLREDVLDIANWGTLTLSAFEHLTDVFLYYDAVVSPTWWHNIVTPLELLPEESHARRVINPNLVDNVIDNPHDLIEIGDPGFYIGADDDGFVPTTRDPKRHLFSFIVFDRFLKHHVFLVRFNPALLTLGASVPYPDQLRAMQQIVVAGKPAYTLMYQDPDISLTDTIGIMPDNTDSLDVLVKALLSAMFACVDGDLTIAERSWNIGTYFHYGLGGSIVISDESVAPPADPADTYVTIGGSDPSHLSHRYADDESGTYLASATVSPSNPLHRVVNVPGKAVFAAADVGMFMLLGTDGFYYEITEVTDEHTVTLSGGAVGTGLTWSLWPQEGSQEGAGVVDWPVQARAYTPGP